MNTLSLLSKLAGRLPFLLLVGLSVLRAEDNEPGWCNFAPDFTPPPTEPALNGPHVAAALDSGALAALIYSAPAATAVTPELQALAAGLDNDPVQIFNYVRNRVDYQPYFGSHKGAHLTYVDGAGNDMDQSSLLIALLNQAGYAETSYVYGRITVPEISADGRDLSHWLCSTAALSSSILSNAGIPIYTSVTRNGVKWWPFVHVWVRVTIAGTTYDLDPSFKQNRISTAIDFTTASGYSRTQLLSDAGGAATADYVQNVSRTNVESRLAQYAATLRSAIKAGYPNAETEEIIGGGRIAEQRIAALAEGAPAAAFTPEATNTFTTIPATYMATTRVRIDSDIDVTFNADSLQGNRVSLTFSGLNAQLWLGDSLVAQQTAGTGATASVTISVAHPKSTYSRSLSAAPYLRTGSYDLSYSLYPNHRSSARIDASTRRLQNYLAAGKTDTSREVLTETLHSLGLKWVRRVALTNAMTATLQGVFGQVHYIFGRTGQESGYYVDMPGVAISMFNGPGTNPKAFNTSSYLSSAMEHGVIEQSGGSAALSTVKCLTLANDAGQKVFRATSANYTATIRSQLTDYSTNQLNSFSSRVGSGYTLLLHQNGQTGLNQWSGFGYSGFTSQLSAMIIDGAYSGGSNSTRGNASGTATVLKTTTSSTHLSQPPNTTNPASGEPVDLLTGAYTMEKAELTLGEQNSPRGLLFARYYDSSRNFANATLGNGWRHSCEGKITLSSELDNAFGFTQPADAAQTIVGILAVGDFVDTTMSAQEMMVGVLAANWTVNRILNNAAVVRLGNQSLTYISQADDSWNPPPGNTTALAGADGAFTLQPRFGGSIVFDAQNRVSQWKDVDNNTQTYAYDSTTGQLATVTDKWGRSLTFNYHTSGVGSGLLQNVTDSTGRSVQFSYTAGTHSGANLTQITDVDAYQTTLVYDGRNRLTDWKDHTLAVVTHNDYDSLDRVHQQLSQGLPTHTWKFLYSPGQTIEVDPQGGEISHYFDYKNRYVATANALGHVATREYDGQNHVVRAVDDTGRQTRFAFDGNQNLSTTTDNDGKITTFLYDGSLRLWKVTDATSRTTEYGYAGHHLTSVTDPGARQTQYFYRSDGLLDHVIDPANKSTTYTAYDTYGNPTNVTRADGTTTSATFNARGDLLTFTDGRGKTTTYTYNNRRLMKTRTDAYHQVTTWTYDSNGYPAAVLDRNGHTTTSEYDNLGHIRNLIAPDTGTIVYNYDTRDWPAGTTDALGHSTVIGHDAAGRRTSITNALSIVTAQWLYDDAGRVSSQFDGLNHETRFRYDATGRLDHTLDPLSHRTDHTYDDAGRPLTLKDRRGNRYDFGYAADGLSTTFTYPSTRQSQIVDRDARGQPKTLQSPSGQTTGMTYDAMGRAKTRTDAVGSVEWSYDNEGNSREVKETVGGTTTTISRVFDDLGRVTSCTDSLGFTVGYIYDPEGNIQTMVYPGGNAVTYTYDGANRIKTVTDWANRKTTYTYDTAGRLQTVDRPNSTRQRVTHDATNRLTGSFEELMSGPTVIGTLWQAGYGYDDANRLTSFDPFPMLKTMAPPSATLTYDADNQLATYNGEAVGSDLDGNLLSAPVQGTLLGVLGWDKRNRLISAGGVTYNYDAENRRITSTTGGQTINYVYSRGAGLDRLLVRQNPDGSLTRYVYGAGLLYEVPASASGTDGSPLYYHFDWRGDTVALSDSAGTVTARLGYSPYGERTIESGTVSTPFCFNGKFGVMTEPTGLLCMQARFYSPVIRRFLNEDPAGFSGGVNLYAYCGGDPVDLMDPFGLAPKNAAGTGSRIMNGVQTGLDVVGLVPGFGEVADGVNALISLGRGDYKGAALSAAAMIPFAGWGATGAKAVLKYGDEATTVIGRVTDLQKVGPGERSLLGRLQPDLENPQVNWHRNSGVLRQEMNRGLPIRDASPGDMGGQFLNAERNLLRDRGWTFDPNTSYWMPPRG